MNKGQKHTQEAKQKMHNKALEQIVNGTRKGTFQAGHKLSEDSLKKMGKSVSENAKINTNSGMKGKHFSDSSRKLMSEHNGMKRDEVKKIVSYKLKGRHLNSEYEFKKGQKPWNKDLSKEEFLKHYPNGMKGGFQLGQVPWSKGKKMSEDFIKKISGSNNHQWLGGKSLEPYNTDFSNSFRNSIRNRDNQLCMNCGIHRETLSRALSVHHINYDKLLSIKENCITLCIKCHALTNFNRPYWISLFQSKLSQLYGYSYSNDNQVILNLMEQSK